MNRRKNREIPTRQLLLAQCVHDPESGCLNWSRAVGKSGYGVIRVFGKSGAVSVHRLIWELVHGDIPKNLCVCHKCDNKRCCNPDHLFLGTHKDNIKDALSKGRWWTSKRLQAARVNHVPERVQQQIMTARGTLREIGNRFNLDPARIWRIRTGKYCTSILFSNKS